MPIVTILHKKKSLAEGDPALASSPLEWECWLAVSESEKEVTYYLKRRAPLDTPDLAAHFQAQAETLWKEAEAEGEKQTDLWAFLPERAALEALSEALRREVNILRQEAGLADYDRVAWEQGLLWSFSG